MTKPKKKKSKPVKPDNTQVKIAAIDSFTQISMSVIKWCGLIGLAYMVSLSIEQVAGIKTHLLLEGFGVLHWIGGIAVGIMMVTNKIQNVSKKRGIAALAVTKKTLEQIIDPHCSSSGLLESGESGVEET